MKKLLVIIMAAAMIAVMSVCTFAADENIAGSASIDAPFCSAWENPYALNDGAYAATSFEADSSVTPHYGSWGATSENYETLSYTWESEVTISSVGLFFWNDKADYETWFSGGGIWIPSSYTIQYWNGTEYVDVTGASGYGVASDVMNVTTFDAVTTTSLQLTLKKVSDAELETVTELSSHGLGISEWEVYGTGAAVEPVDPVDPVEPGETDAPQTGFATIALAIAALASGAYIASKKR